MSIFAFMDKPAAGVFSMFAFTIGFEICVSVLLGGVLSTENFLCGTLGGTAGTNFVSRLEFVSQEGVLDEETVLVFCRGLTLLEPIEAHQ